MAIAPAFAVPADRFVLNGDAIPVPHRLRGNHFRMYLYPKVPYALKTAPDVPKYFSHVKVDRLTADRGCNAERGRWPPRPLTPQNSAGRRMRGRWNAKREAAEPPSNTMGGGREVSSFLYYEFPYRI